MDEKALSGTYKVSFNVDLSVKDNLLQADIAQSIAEGFKDSPILSKLANLNIEDVTPPVTLKPGDKVTFKESLKIEAHLYDDNGTFVIRTFNHEDSRDLGVLQVNLSSMYDATVNSINKEGIELIDFNRSVDVSVCDTETDDVIETPAFIDRLTVKPEAITKVED